MHPLPRRLFTEEEYLLIERAADFRSEYFDGEMYAMAGNGETHSRIVMNIATSLYGQLSGRSCDVHVSEMRVRVADSGLYTYPDIVALCGESRMLDHRRDTLLNPQLIIEILSPSTASYDRGEKGTRYLRIDTLKDYILVEQKQMLVQHRHRQDDQSWVMSDYDELEDTLHIASLGAVLVLSQIYQRIVFPPKIVPPPR